LPSRPTGCIGAIQPVVNATSKMKAQSFMVNSQPQIEDRG
jgi:hypothetical protein